MTQSFKAEQLIQAFVGTMEQICGMTFNLDLQNDLQEFSRQLNIVSISIQIMDSIDQEQIKPEDCLAFCV